MFLVVVCVLTLSVCADQVIKIDPPVNNSNPATSELDINFIKHYPLNNFIDPLQKNLIGRKDGHDNKNGPLIGKNDGHEFSNSKIIGGDDGHEQALKPLIGEDDGHELKPNVVVGGNRQDAYAHVITEKDDVESDSNSLDDYYELEKIPEIITNEDAKDNDKSEDKSEDKSDDTDDTDDDKTLIRCKRPLCELQLDCSHGAKLDFLGCPICECLEDPCKDITCEIGYYCAPIDCPLGKRQTCNTLSYQCKQKRCDGPEPMCASYCPDGYQLNERGCMNCLCKIGKVVENLTKEEKDLSDDRVEEDISYPTDMKEYRNNNHIKDCDIYHCNVDQICKESIFTGKSSCIAKPLCYIAQEMNGLERDGKGHLNNAYISQKGSGLSNVFIPECSDMGLFKPTQWYNDQCWCVDDAGREIENSRWIGYGPIPECKLNKTTELTFEMKINVPDLEIMNHKNELIKLMAVQISKWLNVNLISVEVKQLIDNSMVVENELIAKVLLREDPFASFDLQSAFAYLTKRANLGLKYEFNKGEIAKNKKPFVSNDELLAFRFFRSILKVKSGSLKVICEKNVPNFKPLTFRSESEGGNGGYLGPLKPAKYNSAFLLVMAIAIMMILSVIGSIVWVIFSCKNRNRHNPMRLPTENQNTFSKDYYKKKNNETVVLVSDDVLEKNGVI